MKLHHIALTVNDLKTSIKYYQSYFNFELIKEFEKKEINGKGALLKLDEIHLELWQFANSKTSQDLNELQVIGIRHIAFQVDDCEKEVKRLTKLGLAFSEIKPGASCTKYGFTKDPNGIPIELYQK